MKKMIFLSAILFSSVGFTAENEIWKCVGTEPFWSVRIEGKKITFEDPTQHSEFNQTNILYPVGMAPEIGFVISAQGQATDATLTVRKDATCNDGMSDQPYSHELWFSTKDHLFVGCCNKLP
jgi:uncharacterized membrane protein